MPNYERYQRLSREINNAVTLGSLSVSWKDGGQALEYQRNGKRFRYEIASDTETELGPGNTNGAPRASSERPRRRRNLQGSERPARGRQYSSALSPDGKKKAFYRGRNLWLSDAQGTNEIALTTDGSESNRIKYGTASWVYGEELAQTTAIWWSSNSQKVAFYRFDESQVPDYYLIDHQTNIQDRLEVEPYNKAGGTNPIVDLLIYDLPTRKTIQLDVRQGKEFCDSVPGHYVYGVSWSADSKELLFHRTDRLQKVLEFCAADADSGKCRVIVREEWPASWVDNSPPLRFLKDRRRFIWTSERTGWRNLYLYDLAGTLLATLTHHEFEVGDVEYLDEEAGTVFYTARSGDNPLKMQLHRVGLDGRGDLRLTDPAFHHTIDVAPDGRHFIDIAETHDSPPTTRLMDVQGKVVRQLAETDMAKYKQLHLKSAELLTFKAADGHTDLYGLLQFPSNFTLEKKYPLLVSIYAGPATSGAHESFLLPNALTELGFLVASFDSRSADGRGKRFLDAIYARLGIVEIDDQAAGVKSLWSRRYLDKKRVGIYGTSYGGTASALCLLRYPDVFHAACSSSPVTDFRNYDTIYTERYLGLPQDNQDAYEAVSLMTYADRLKGRLMLYYGTADDNVHPSNMMQFVRALQRAGKSFELQVGPDLGHGSINRERMMEFFIENLAR